MRMAQLQVKKNYLSGFKSLKHNMFYLQFVHKKVLGLQGAEKAIKEYKKHSKRPILS